MMELLQPLAACLALLAVACVAFARPEGAVARAMIAAGIAAVCAGVVWRSAPSGELSHWLAAFLVALAAAMLFGLAALLRHMFNAIGARALY